MEFIKRNPKIFILSGKARSGKNEVASIISNYYNSSIKISYGHYLKEYVKKICNWDGQDETKPREMLQELGIKLIKEQIDNKLLIRRVIEDIKVYSYFFDVIIIEDARLIDEIEDLKKEFDNITVIRVIRNIENNLTKEQKEHITETNLDNYQDFDYIIKNDDINNLEKQVIDILGGKENE